MRFISSITLVLISNLCFAQQPEKISPFDGRHWGVVVDHPDTKKILVKENIHYATLGRPLHLDVYFPQALASNETRKTVVILNGIGDQAGDPGAKTSPGQTSWARLLAAHGFVVVTMESEVNKIQESFAALFNFLSENGNQFHIDTNAIGVQAFSANCRESVSYVMKPDSFKGIKAAVFYYGESPGGTFRGDLPVLFVVAGLDIRGNNYAGLWENVLKSNAPWTISVAREMPHAFDFFSDTETSRRVIASTLSFWNDQLSPLPVKTSTFSKEREIVAATYYRDPKIKLGLMREWMDEHPDSNDAYAFSAYASALMENHEFSEAEKYLKKAIVNAPENKGNHLMLAVVSYVLGKTKQGDTNLAEYEKGSTPEAFTYFYIADRLRAVKKYEQAAALYERALTFPNPRSFLFYNLGVTYALLGNSDKAFQNLFKAAEMDFGTKQSYEADESLKSLRSDGRWGELVGKF